eukprot:TRINITY_DN92680_c0_g1_i1.p1 TRINITY_DN92680_c0_g1~~TRINITY_DN92680_c0_g1_i1.p1  ORF type:complete len:384 (+),score=44.57 TRINITY_DN92680_c0_g1_i1:78-1154(+)
MGLGGSHCCKPNDRCKELSRDSAWVPRSLSSDPDAKLSPRDFRGESFDDGPSLKRMKRSRVHPHSSLPCSSFFGSVSVSILPEQASNVVLALPLLGDIVSYLDGPQDVIHMCRTSAKWIVEDAAMIYAQQWKRLYALKWPAFFEAECYLAQKRQMKVNWHSVYFHTLHGSCEFLVEVFNREKKMGFAMSCMSARVSWDRSGNAYVAHYQSASPVLPELIPSGERDRLRFCPGSARQQLYPELIPPEAPDNYPYRILRGLDNLQVGQGCELQWKMQMGSPFGWWYGTVECIERLSNAATVTMIFEHFPPTSRWYRLRVIVGDGVMRRCAIGGHHGGIRAVSQVEKQQWMKFKPKEAVIF